MAGQKLLSLTFEFRGAQRDAIVQQDFYIGLDRNPPETSICHTTCGIRIYNYAVRETNDPVDWFESNEGLAKNLRDGKIAILANSDNGELVTQSENKRYFKTDLCYWGL